MLDSGQDASTRYRMLDLVRGVTVLLMIAAHAIYFFHNDTSVILTFFENFGNTLAFTVFLIVSATTAEIAYYSKEDLWPEKRKRLIKRVLILLAGYFVLAFTIFFANIVSTYGLARIGLIFDIITLRNLAPFAEFYIPFIVIPLVIAVFPRFFQKVIKSVPLTLALGLAVYLLGMFYYQMPIWEFLLPWKALLFGAPGYYRFPIFQYFPVYLLGLVWGNWLLTSRTLKHQIETTKAILITSISGIAVSALIFLLTGNSLAIMLKRWPPSIPFLLIGVSFAAFLALVFYATKQLQKISLLRDGILVLGQNALGLALTHVFLLQIYSLSGGLRTGSILIYLFSFVILLLLSLALAAIIPFNFRLSLNLERGQYNENQLEEEALVQFEEEATEDLEKDVSWFKRFFFLGPVARSSSRKLIKKRHLLGISLILATTAIILLPPVVEEYNYQKNNSAVVSWDGSDYGWRQNLNIKNTESLAEIPKGGVLSWQLNLPELVKNKKAYSDGKDILIRYWDGKGYQPVKFWLTGGSNQPSTTISVELRERLKPGDSTNKYYLYYGNNLAQKKAESGETPKEISVKHTVETKAEEPYPLLLTVDRRWSLLSDDPKVPTSLRVALQTIDNYSASEANYVIPGTKVKGVLTKTTDKQWEGVVDTKELKPGEYHLTAQITDGDKQINTSGTGFFVSYPLYVSWTQDWEGYDVPDGYLSAITQVARDHDIIITHFWNPRLTTTDTVTQNRKGTLLAWIKNRQATFGESIQLHLHMFKDFVSACGIEPKYYPNWGDSGDGYGSLTTNYNAGELTKIITKAVDTMKASGLKMPTIYRAGGWFANEDTLQAVENSGILADSSGRTAYKFYAQTGPWNLAETAQPYYPSKNDQNKAGTPSLSILEIPNNGADSYWFSTKDMKNRFDSNYTGGILTEPKQITYLSHPHWFNKAEQAKIEDVFDYIDNFKYDGDNGPAIYVTLDEIYSIWAKK